MNFLITLGKGIVVSYQARFRCIDDRCAATFSLDQVIYNCDRCGSLLRVEHDIERLKSRSADEWRALFDERRGSSRFPFESGVWRFKEWINPTIDDASIVSMLEGNSPMFKVDRLGAKLGLSDLWVKLCGDARSGSFKDLGMTVLVSQVNDILRKKTGAIRAVACASTGDTSAALAAYCAFAGLKAIVFLPAGKVTNEQLVQPISSGALVLTIDTDFDGCMKIVQAISEDKSIYLANSKNSLRIEGQKSVALEIAQRFNWKPPDVVVVPGGNLGNAAALGAGFLMLEQLGLIDARTRIVVAQAANANPLYLSYKNHFARFDPVKAKKTVASAIQIGDPVSRPKTIETLKQFNGIVEEATENEIARACAIADRNGLYACPHTGVALAALEKLRRAGEIKSDSKVVVISTAHGLKFSGFKNDYHQKNLPGIDSALANPPQMVKPNVDDVKRAIAHSLRDPR